MLAVGLDIETTSLDPAHGEIIEVAAIRFNLKTGAALGRFEALAAPKNPVTSETTALTGITNDMLTGQSPFRAHSKSLKKFIGDDIIFAHNANFDLTWLAHHGCQLDNPVWDTFTLAGVAWPESPSYNLGTLARQFGLEVAGEHRAAADIVMSHALLQKVMAALSMSPKVAAHIKHLLTVSQQTHYLPLFTTTREKPGKGSREKSSAHPAQGKNLSIERILGNQGILTQALPGFQARPQQQALAAYIHDQAESGQSALVEAGAGIGKTYAYVAAAVSLGGRLLVSTYTRVLQDQLVEKDIPLLLQALGISRSVASLKGRRHYICARRLAKALTRDKLTAEDAWSLIKVLLWLAHGGSGDTERLNFSHQNWRLLHSLHADSPICRLQCSRKAIPDCPYQIARQAASQADITVVNHSLLVGWGTGEEQGSNTYSLIVIDEAHHLEDAAISASEIDFSYERVAEITATLARLIPQEKITTECERLGPEYKKLLGEALAFMEQHTPDKTLRLSRTVRRGSAFRNFSAQVEQWQSRLNFILGLLRSHEEKIGRKDNQLYKETFSNLQQLSIELQQFMSGQSLERVSWLQRRGDQPDATLRDACLNPHPYIQGIFAQTAPVMLLSATLTTNNSFEYISRRLDLTQLPTQQFPGEFDFAAQMKIFITENGPYPNTDQFDQFISKRIEELSHITTGRLLALFTSQAGLESVHAKIRGALYKENIKLLSQGLTGGRHNIAKRFRDEDASVLLGSASFWEGFDSPGETLSVVVIPRLPFPQLTDPIIEALSEQAGEGRAFSEVMLPRMILRLRQGIGRLLRLHSDRGVVVILDRRLVEKDYGSGTLKSLPEAPIEILSVDQLSHAVSIWFGAETLRRWRDQHHAQ